MVTEDEALEAFLKLKEYMDDIGGCNDCVLGHICAIDYCIRDWDLCSEIPIHKPEDHAKWVYLGRSSFFKDPEGVEYECSRCGHVIMLLRSDLPRRCRCGAVMDGTVPGEIIIDKNFVEVE